MSAKYEINPEHPLAMAYPYFPPEEQVRLKEELGEILNGKLSQGPRTAEFEKRFAGLCGASAGVAFTTCTAALESALMACGLKNGDEVIVPAETFVATGMAVHLAGGRPLFAEISPKSFSLDFNDAWSRVTDRTRGAIVVHFGGLIDEGLTDFVKKMKASGRFVIEDAAHAHGAKLGDKFAGSLADAGCFSFYPTKIMTTGEGGMLTTSRQDIARMARSLQNRGLDLDSKTESYLLPGRNNRFPEISAAMGLSQLRSLPEFLKARRLIGATYDKLMAKHDFFCPLTPAKGSQPSYWRYTLVGQKAFNRDGLKIALAEEGIAIDWAYDPALHLQPVFKNLYDTKPGQLPISEDLLSRHICLPMHARLRPQDAEYVVERLNFHLKRHT